MGSKTEVGILPNSTPVIINRRCGPGMLAGMKGETIVAWRHTAMNGLGETVPEVMLYTVLLEDGHVVRAFRNEFEPVGGDDV